ncbi:hypothetical protein [Natronosalvus rutilus]|uniref:Uncharacterized protein n=1 Tax=Natronosalvus rutilus TaxID=2953753 RepID=A0A9E7NDX5_9EURY|nr:hypothetical protein [Natronosalvus rutilus]UTF55551.1 hypothetical protein NGM29_02965 [Natronosalvus rutilus]
MTKATPDGRQLAESGDEGDETAPETARDDEDETTHLEDVDVGAGCTEIWEHLAERRKE